MAVEVLYQGQSRYIYVWGSAVEFKRWTEAMQRPPQAVLMRTVWAVADREMFELLRAGKTWKPVKGSKPKLYQIQQDQARLYCCFRGEDIVILAWEQKKQDKADENVLARAERRAKELLGLV